MKMLTLSYLNETVQLYETDAAVSVGRSELNDLVFYDQIVSDRHGRFYFKAV